MDKQKALEKVAQEIRACKKCKMWGTGEPVPGEGSPDAKVAFIGEAPGKEEAKTGRPFVGRSGKFLRKAIRDIGLSEEEVYITSPVKYLPTRGTPSKENILHSKEHFLKQMEIINPKIIVLLGSVASFAVLNETVPITKEHGKVIEKNGRFYFITFHPAAAVRFDATRQKFLEDFQKLKKLINSLSP